MKTPPLVAPIFDLIYPPFAAMDSRQAARICPSRAEQISHRVDSSSHAVDRHGSVAVIEVVGPQEPIDTLRMIDQLDAARTDESVTKILAYFNSPGGAAQFGEEGYLAFQRASAVKETIAACEGYLCSLAFFFACGCRRIIASPGTIVGSIGTRILLLDSSEWFKSLGLRAVPVDTGKYKSAGAPGVVIDEETQQYFQDIVDAVFRPFKAAVARGRRMDARRVADLCDARIYTATQALALGLIDEVALLSDVIARFEQDDSTGQADLYSVPAKLSAAEMLAASRLPSKPLTDLERKRDMMAAQAALIASQEKQLAARSR